jgi:hypothetical protein
MTNNGEVKMNFPADILLKLDVTNLLAIAAMLWFFNSRLDRKFDKVDSKIGEVKSDLGKRIDDQSKPMDDLNAKVDKVECRFDPLQHTLNDIETFICHRNCVAYERLLYVETGSKSKKS